MSGARHHSGALRDDRGFIVVVVLWMLAALAALALIYLTYVTNTAVTVAVNADRLQTDALVNAGLELAAYRLTAQNEATRPTSGTFNARVGAGRVSVTFRSEAARIDLNMAPKPILAGLMTALGVSADNAPVYADRIVAWRSSTEPGQDNPEDTYYRTLGASYLPRHAPFPHGDELWLVRGIPPAVVERVLPFVTVFSNMRTVNVLDAAPQVVAALPGMTPQTLQQVLRDRTDPNIDPRSLVGLAGGGAATIEGAKAYRLTVAVEAPSHRQSSAEIVILLLESGDEPYRVLSWHNDFDGSAGKPL
ncbi:general secretion pathway protein K [Bradyrhizobium japonicum]|uniref:general secretion pathway protein GspK n=1 Tax=Bradyrhizobium japonicum TaxID=375 RepID=UPI002167BAFB|nr:general secretion pathway protein GspK [Bradyrhizobium japonicum]MCS3495055.1 general secretion pathway protein K [Bradyrhizobium japonicum]MCS3962782.1 general secretion pathway protein K [Bradyrhizobium japonicum]MCS3995098.1 general secretion pathway protein K [Bradyrhizobium japonicum]